MAKFVAVEDGHGTGIEYINDSAVAGAIDVKNGTFILRGATATAYTLALPRPGAVSRNGDDGKTLKIISATAAAHTVTVPTKLNTGAAGSGTVTLGGAVGDGIELVAWNGAWLVAPGGKSNATVA